MADIMSILQSSYAAAPQSLIAPGSKFANVDPTKWAGHLDRHRRQETARHGLDHQGHGLPRQCDGQRCHRGLQNARAFITTKNTFRVGNSQFVLTGTGKAKLITIVTDPNTGKQSALTVPLTLKT